MTETSIVDREVEQFAKLAGDWWDPNGSSATTAYCTRGWRPDGTAESPALQGSARSSWWRSTAALSRAGETKQHACRPCSMS